MTTTVTTKPVEGQVFTQAYNKQTRMTATLRTKFSGGKPVGVTAIRGFAPKPNWADSSDAIIPSGELEVLADALREHAEALADLGGTLAAVLEQGE